MKYSILLLMIFGLSRQISFGQNSNSKTQEITYQYYDKDDNVISESQFNDIRQKGGFYIIKNDSLKIAKLTPTKDQGTLKNKDQFVNYLEKLTDHQIDTKKPIILIYHAGKDRCNSSGSATIATSKAWNNKLERVTNRIAGVKPIYICKNYSDLEERDKVSEYFEDTNQVIETMFFKFHYPCSSFVIISENGEYYSSFGEFGKEAVWRILKKMK